MPTSSTHRPTLCRIAVIALALGLAGAMSTGLSACRGERTSKRPRRIFPDLDAQPKYQAQQRSTFFKDFKDPETGQWYGRTQRQPIQGSVAFGKKPWGKSFAGVDFSQRDSFLQDDLELYEGKRYVRSRAGRIQYDDAGAPQTAYLDRIPVDRVLGVSRTDPAFPQAMRDLINVGRENFNIYCIVCHGATGQGDGMVGRRWAYVLPNWHDPQYQRGGEKGQDGYIFHTLLYGVPNAGDNVPYPFKMRGYLGRVSRSEAWAIVAYFRSLQEARKGTIDTVPPDQRQPLLDQRSAPDSQALLSPAGKEQPS